MNDPLPSTTTALAACAGSYLTFALGDEIYGVEILRVREIIGMLPVTRLPGSADEVLGVVNLRGRVIPVVSLRTRFGLPRAEPHPHNVTIVVEQNTTRVGLAVDRVCEVARFSADQLEESPACIASTNSSFVRAIGKRGEQVTVLLDVQRVISALAINTIGTIVNSTL